MFEACLAPAEPQLSHGCQEPFPTGDTLWLRKGSNIAPQEVQYSVQSLILRQWQFEPSALNCTCCRGHPTHSGFTGSKDTVGSNGPQKLCLQSFKAMISTFYWPAELKAAWSMSTAELRAANRLCKAVKVFDCVWSLAAGDTCNQSWRATDATGDFVKVCQRKQCPYLPSHPAEAVYQSDRHVSKSTTFLSLLASRPLQFLCLLSLYDPSCHQFSSFWPPWFKRRKRSWKPFLKALAETQPWSFRRTPRVPVRRGNYTRKRPQTAQRVGSQCARYKQQAMEQ